MAQGIFRIYEYCLKAKKAVEGFDGHSLVAKEDQAVLIR